MMMEHATQYRMSIVGAALCASLGAQDERILRRPYNQFDQDKNGVVSEKEFPGNPALFKLMDKNRDRKVTFDEYKVSSLARRYLAAVRVNSDEPRKRVGTADLANRRLDVLARFDKNKDGKIKKSEWTGSPDGFRSLDIDGNGVIDKKDRLRAKSEADVLSKALNRLPKVKSRLPSTKKALQYYDKDKDGMLSLKEASKSPFDKLFPYSDKNKDKQLDERELNRVIGEVNKIVTARDMGYAQARAPTIPFRAWDKNNDGRVDLKEWVEMKDLFKLMDINRDAAVTPDEVVRFKKSFEGKNFIEKFDLNGDNRVTRQEFAGTRAAFDRADRNGDGVISKRDR